MPEGAAKAALRERLSWQHLNKGQLQIFCAGQEEGRLSAWDSRKHMLRRERSIKL
jgi:hypothetical protein